MTLALISGLGGLIIILLALALIWWLVSQLPFEALWKKFIQAVLILIAIYVVLRAVGLF